MCIALTDGWDLPSSFSFHVMQYLNDYVVNMSFAVRAAQQSLRETSRPILVLQQMHHITFTKQHQHSTTNARSSSSSSPKDLELWGHK